jgi:hypothetical protein
MTERRSALAAVAKWQGHTFGRDPLLDDVIYAGDTGHLPKGKGLDAETRGFVELLWYYQREKDIAALERRSKTGIL